MTSTNEHLHDEIKSLRMKIRELKEENDLFELRLKEQNDLIYELKLKLGILKVKVEGYVS